MDCCKRKIKLEEEYCRWKEVVRVRKEKMCTTGWDLSRCKRILQEYLCWALILGFYSLLFPSDAAEMRLGQFWGTHTLFWHILDNWLHFQHMTSFGRYVDPWHWWGLTMSETFTNPLSSWVWKHLYKLLAFSQTICFLYSVSHHRLGTFSIWTEVQSIMLWQIFFFWHINQFWLKKKERRKPLCESSCKASSEWRATARSMELGGQ